ncbi:MAG: N-6 DNA methylase [Flavobacterium sp.]|nr:N-6 DNA methylase [Flavobacterium sp.]
MTIQQYLTKVETLYKTGNAREHSYRGDLQNLIMAILPDILVTNEPARVACGAPDYVLTRKDVPVGYIEAKDIGVDLGSKTLKEQFERYKLGLSNLVFTDYMDFHFYKDGELTTKIAIAKLENGTIVPQPENFDQFTQLIKNFAETISQTIKSPTKLAQMMAGKAKLMADVIEKSLNYDDQEGKRSTIKSQMLSFQQMLIHDIDNKSFADIYSQTIAYGMFAARYHDPTLPTFSRMEAAELIPKSNPFLRKLFQDIAGFDLDTRITWIVDELVNIFLASDVALIMKNFGKSTKQEDPVVHFYETFLGEYNPALRKARGVWYTPQPVVNFIVRAVDDILKTEFDLPQGLADTSKIKIKKKAVTQIGKGANSKIKEVEIEHEVHKVQILDPATGTGTFLAEVVKHIHKKFEGQQGIWSKYVTKDLIPRLNGFELLMASYAMAHLKMDMLLTETGYKPTDAQRFKIFLTNSLEEPSEQNFDLFNWLADEANEANAVKKDAPVMAIIGNPPYSGVSANNGKWISNLIDVYKKEPNGTKLKEQNSKYLNDDYVKFIRLSQYLITKNGEGVLAFISNNGYIDNPTFRGMRASLAKSFTDIYIIDLHGNSKKQEKNIDGTADQNVFDIMVGVAIIIAVKKKNSKDEAKIHHFDCLGKRDYKYQFLNENSLKTIPFSNFKPSLPFYNFYTVNNDLQSKYYDLIALENLFSMNSVGVKSSRDALLVTNTKQDLEDNLHFFMEKNTSEIESKYSIKFNKTWEHKALIEKLSLINLKNEIQKIRYRPFDDMFICYNDFLVDRTRKKVMQNLVNKSNTALIVGRQGQAVAGDTWNIAFVSDCLSDMNIFARGGGMSFPLYLYPETNIQQTIDDINIRIPNLNTVIVKQIADGLGMTFTNEKEIESNVCFANSDEVRPEFKQSFAPIDLLDYIYAVLHSPTYREKYKEFLKIDFPRVPLPTDADQFWKLVALGDELRQIHLLESPIVEKYITQYPEDGDNIVTKPIYKNGNVYVNEEQYFANVPEVAWNFYIGGYQPAQKWLKDRKTRELGYDDILHYQKIIVALSETDRIMKEIDLIKI